MRHLNDGGLLIQVQPQSAGKIRIHLSASNQVRACIHDQPSDPGSVPRGSLVKCFVSCQAGWFLCKCDTSSGAACLEGSVEPAGDV